MYLTNLTADGGTKCCLFSASLPKNLWHSLFTVSFFYSSFFEQFWPLGCAGCRVRGQFGRQSFGQQFFIGPRQVKAHDEPYVGRTSKKYGILHSSMAKMQEKKQLPK